MQTVKRLILVRIPLSICNFRCSYCYLTHRNSFFQNEQVDYNYSPEYVANALSVKRLGGVSYMNFCANGETLLAKDLDKYIFELVKQGHYAEIVTNLTITPVIDKILSWDKELLKRVEFKCSFHYLQLKQKKLLETFADNVNKIWRAGASANIEITPDDELIPYIDEVKKFSLKNFGALPHLSIARNDASKSIDYLTELTVEEYDKIWSQFDSEFWRFKKTIFKEKRKEFCYAGDWSLYVDITTGETTQCYCTNTVFNIFKDLNKPIPFKAIGKCGLAHCYNGHALLALGCIPHFTDVKYGNIRNRIKTDGTQWLQPELLSFFNTKLEDSNEEYSRCKKVFTRGENQVLKMIRISERVANKVKRILVK